MAVTVAVLVQSTGSWRPEIIPHLQNARGHHSNPSPPGALWYLRRPSTRAWHPTTMRGGKAVGEGTQLRREGNARTAVEAREHPERKAYDREHPERKT